MLLSATVLNILWSTLVLLVVIFVFSLMRPRRFYFIRHGETLLNAAHVKQGAEGGLSEVGKRQASAVGTMLAPLRIQKIISSPYERAKQTVDIINEQLHVPTLYTHLLAERRSPSDIIGKDRDDPATILISDQIDLAYHADDFQHLDEETFIDMKKRARACLRYLILHSATRNCVVTHHVFLKMMLSYMLYREELHVRGFIKLSFFNVSDNGGVSICEFHPWKILFKNRGWEIVSFNEQP